MAETCDPATVVVPGPLDAHLGLNARAHWARKADSTSLARERWRLATQQARLPTFDAVRLQVTAYFCKLRPGPESPGHLQSRTGYRPRDTDNLMAAMKPAYDGMVDAGLVSDDDKRHVSHDTPRIEYVGSFAEERVEVTITPAEHE